MNHVKLVATDLDGTFLKDDRTISTGNLEALEELGKKQIARVAATGRNLNKVREVISDDTPFDFIVFSSGAGVYDWQRKEHIYIQNIDSVTSEKMIRYLIQEKLNFHVFYPAPENHKHWYYRGNEHCREFERYFTFNQAYSSELNERNIPDSEVCQFLVIIPEDVNRYSQLKRRFEKVSPEIRVIRSSSPITKGYIWIEIFHHTVSKGNAVRHLCEILDINVQHTMGIGNDYNDLDLLEFTQHSVVVANSPEEIKKDFKVTKSNEDDGFAEAVKWIVE
jgi:hypothetical protein